MVTKQMWLPSSADHGSRTFVAGVDTSRPVIDRCRVCRIPFFEGEEHRVHEHLVACARRNHERLVAQVKRAHPDILKPWDTDFHAWVQKHRTSLLEGRKRA